MNKFFNLVLPRVGDPEVGDLLDEVLAEFDWKFGEMVGKAHPVTTGNCAPYQHPHAAGGSMEAGFYENAAFSCLHCYPGSNPVRVEWDRHKVTLECEVRSSKIIRALAAFHRLNGTEVGVGCDVDYTELPYLQAEVRK